MNERIEYYYDETAVSGEPYASRHAQILDVLRQLEASGRSTVAVRARAGAFSQKVDQDALLKTLSDFSMSHHVGLARPFGSNRQGFWYLPSQFLLVSEGGRLREVFPCEINRRRIEPLDFLESMARGEAWTPRAGGSAGGRGKHADIVERLAREPAQLEAGLTLVGREVPVSKDFGEFGRVDLVFKDRNGCYLLVEVKVNPTEIAKAIGQVLMHRHLFALQNGIERKKVRAAVACPYFPAHWQSVCADAGLACFVVATGAAT
jgi:Endonuclease NucS C-terminal domain